MLTIAIDFDDTLFPTTGNVLEAYNKKHGTKFEMSQIASYSLYESFDSDVADELIKMFVDKTIYDSLQPYKGAVRAIKSLVERGHEVYIATATDVKNMAMKEELLRKYFPFIPKDNLIRIHNKALLSVDVMIDDKLDNLKGTFAERICFNQQWNVDSHTDYAYSITRINSWSEILNVINSIERKNKEWEK